MHPTDHIQVVTFQLAGVSGPIFGALLANPGMAHVTTREFGILERPTEITRPDG